MLRLRCFRVQRLRLRTRNLAHETGRARRKRTPAACSAADGRRARTAAAPGYARARKGPSARSHGAYACACARTCGSAARRRGTGAGPLPQRQPLRRRTRFRRRWRPPRAPPRTSRPPPPAACAATPAAAPGGAAMLQCNKTTCKQAGSISSGGQHARDLHAPVCCCEGTMRKGMRRCAKPPFEAPGVGDARDGSPHAFGGRLSAAAAGAASAWNATTCMRPTCAQQHVSWRKPRRTINRAARTRRASAPCLCFRQRRRR